MSEWFTHSIFRVSFQTRIFLFEAAMYSPETHCKNEIDCKWRSDPDKPMTLFYNDEIDSEIDLFEDLDPDLNFLPQNSSV